MRSPCTHTFTYVDMHIYTVSNTVHPYPISTAIPYGEASYVYRVGEENMWLHAVQIFIYILATSSIEQNVRDSSKKSIYTNIYDDYH